MNSHKTLRYLLLATTGIIATSGPSFAEVVYSQNFDSTVLGQVDIPPTQGGPSGGFSERSWGSYNDITSLPAGWSINCTDPAPTCGVFAFHGSTPAGDTEFDFDGHTAITLNEEPGANNSISTTINGLIAGQTYSLSFEYWGDNNPTPADPAYPFDVIVNGNATHYTGNDIGPPPDGTFNTGTLTFVANGGGDTLKFLETTTSPDESSVIIDNISVSDTPEPGTFGMLFLASGILALGWTKRSKLA